MTVVVAASCVNHPARQAIGVCVECRSRVCAECVTKIDGINHCVACYQARADRASTKSRAETKSSGKAVSVLSAGVLFTTAVLLYWALLAVGLPGG